MAWKLGRVGHFSIAVSDPRASADWWIGNFGLHELFADEDVVAVAGEAILIGLRRGTPAPAGGHLAFLLGSMAELNEALADLRARGVDLEDPGDEIGPVGPGSKHMGLWFHDPDGYRWELMVQAAEA